MCKIFLNQPQRKIGQHDKIVFVLTWCDSIVVFALRKVNSLNYCMHTLRKGKASQDLISLNSQLTHDSRLGL